jgi:hypothetical protein
VRIVTRSDDFDLAVLHQALDAERRTRGLTWTAATKEMSVAPSTVAGLRTRSVAEADGVLQMLRWLGRAPESFGADHRVAAAAESLPDAGPGQILRIDTRELHAALDALRIERRLTWDGVARELGVGVSSLTRLADGGRTAFPQVMRMTRWLGEPVARFVRRSDR